MWVRGGETTGSKRAVAALIGLVLVGGMGACSSGDDSESGADTTATRPPATESSDVGVTTSPEAPDASEAPETSDVPDTVETTSAASPSGLTVEGAPDLTAPQLVVGDAAFPLTLSPDGQYLVDQDGVPFLIQGDAAWSLIVQLDLTDVDRYLDSRRALGFNTLVVNLIEHKFSDDPPRNTSGAAPFLDEGDFTTPNADYFDEAAEVIQHAADRGFAVLLAPAYLGWMGGDEGWYQEMSANGVEALREYGRFVGERFAEFDNIIWLLGGDYTPPSEGVELVDAVEQGIVDGGATQLRTAHWGPEWSAADIPVDWLDLNTTYTYGLVYELSLDDEQRADGLPHFLIESKYEDDIFETTPQWVRAQAYYALLTGSIGQVFGHGDIWQFREGWPDALHSIGSLDMARVRTLWDTLPWTDLEFDIDQQLVAEGTGEFGTEDFAAAARTPDGAVTVVYVPTDRDAVELELGDDVGAVAVRWYDPTDGTFVAATATVVDEGRLRVEDPGSNAAGDADWILLVESVG